MRTTLVVVCLGAWLCAGCGSESPAPAGETLGGLPLEQFLRERDRFLPATDPRTEPAARARWLEPEDEVFGVVVKGQARAYPITMLSYHHVVNDVIQGVPVAVTY